MSLKNGITNEEMNYLLKLTNLNEINFGVYIDESFNDINLSPDIIEKFVKINKFELFSKNIIVPVEEVEGFLHIKELRNKLNKKRKD